MSENFLTGVDLIFVIGGNDGAVLNRVDVYDLTKKKWIAYPPLITKRDEHSITIGPDGMIYAIGGYGGIKSNTSFICQ